MTVSEVIKKYYFDKHFLITNDELELFVKEYLEINKLSDEYMNRDINRKEVGQKISQRIDNIKILMEIFKRDLANCKANSESNEYIRDYELALHVLLKLANKNEKYILKRFVTEQMIPYENVKGDKNSALDEGIILVIGKKDVLEKIDNTKTYCGTKFAHIVDDILENGNSLIVISDNYCESGVLPIKSLTDVNNYVFKVESLDYENIYCYTFNDELNEAVLKIKKYVEVYGGDLRNLSFYTIISRIAELEIEEKTSTLNRNKNN